MARPQKYANVAEKSHACRQRKQAKRDDELNTLQSQLLATQVQLAHMRRELTTAIRQRNDAQSGRRYLTLKARALDALQRMQPGQTLQRGHENRWLLSPVEKAENEPELRDAIETL